MKQEITDAIESIKATCQHDNAGIETICKIADHIKTLNDVANAYRVNQIVLERRLTQEQKSADTLRERLKEQVEQTQITYQQIHDRVIKIIEYHAPEALINTNKNGHPIEQIVASTIMQIKSINPNTL